MSVMLGTLTKEGFPFTGSNKSGAPLDVSAPEGCQGQVE